MVSSMEVKALSANVVSLVGLLRKHKVSERRRRLRRAAVVQLKWSAAGCVSESRWILPGVLAKTLAINFNCFVLSSPAHSSINSIFTKEAANSSVSGWSEVSEQLIRSKHGWSKRSGSKSKDWGVWTGKGFKKIIWKAIFLKYYLQDWDVSTDPELQKVLNVAKLLGRTVPPNIKNVKKVLITRFWLVDTQLYWSLIGWLGPRVQSSSLANQNVEESQSNSQECDGLTPEKSGRVWYKWR